MGPTARIARVCPVMLWAGLATAAAQTEPAELGVGAELVIAVDISRSIDPDEQLIQRQGYAAAFRSKDVQDAIMHGGWGRVAITYVEWAGEPIQNIIIPWTLIDSADAAHGFADRIEQGSPRSASRTSISGVISFSAEMFEQNGYTGLRRVIDVSGDGPNNQGRGVTEARDAALMRGITINGLPLMTNGRREAAFGFGRWSTIANLDAYYADCVIGGPGAFAIPVTAWDQFANAVRQKLVLELAGRQPPQPERLIQAQARMPIDCLIGEKMRAERQRDLGRD
ncbi:hypothetical protein CUV01_14395 [Paracoccus tegillarcae]|uniref:DUF1194 domain-containing protein n=1 Tax=Paracoccus tegillarcae TaxID=1529068 RepID=A0A2K9EHF1_9RHOB|nr:hypothetical protein CUV01_14395 [Paracoccus tegillarcae]